MKKTVVQKKEEVFLSRIVVFKPLALGVYESPSWGAAGRWGEAERIDEVVLWALHLHFNPCP